MWHQWISFDFCCVCRPNQCQCAIAWLMCCLGEWTFPQMQTYTLARTHAYSPARNRANTFIRQCDNGILNLAGWSVCSHLISINFVNTTHKTVCGRYKQNWIFILFFNFQRARLCCSFLFRSIVISIKYDRDFYVEIEQVRREFSTWNFLSFVLRQKFQGYRSINFIVLVASNSNQFDWFTQIYLAVGVCVHKFHYGSILESSVGEIRAMQWSKRIGIPFAIELVCVRGIQLSKVDINDSISRA